MATSECASTATPTNFTIFRPPPTPKLTPSDPPPSSRRPGPTSRLRDSQTHARTRRLRARLRSRNTVREIPRARPEHAFVWISAVERPFGWRRISLEKIEDRKRLSFSRHPEIPRTKFRRIRLGHLPRVDDAVHVRDALQHMPRQTAPARIAGRETRRLVYCRFHRVLS